MLNNLCWFTVGFCLGGLILIYLQRHSWRLLADFFDRINVMEHDMAAEEALTALYKDVDITFVTPKRSPGRPRKAPQPSVTAAPPSKRRVH